MRAIESSVDALGPLDRVRVLNRVLRDALDAMPRPQARASSNMPEPSAPELQKRLLRLVQQLDQERSARIKAERGLHAARMTLARQRLDRGVEGRAGR